MVMEKKFEFDSAGIELLKVSAASADLQIEPVEQGNIVAYVDVKGEDYVPEAEKSGKKLSIRFQKGTNIGIPFIKNLFDKQAEIDNIRLQVPKSILEMDINNASGDISLEDFDLANLKINNVSGDVKMQNCVTKDLQFNTVSGDLSFVASNYARGKFNSVSGDLMIKGLPPMKRDTGVSSVSGDTVIYYSKEPRFDASISSVSGDMNSDFTLVKVDKKRYRSTKGDPQEYIKMSSVSGDLIIKAKYSGSEAREVAVEEPATAENHKVPKPSVVEENLQDHETMKIITLFHEGKLTEDYAREMLTILGYTEAEIEEMLKVDEELRKLKETELEELDERTDEIDKPEKPEKIKEVKEVIRDIKEVKDIKGVKNAKEVKDMREVSGDPEETTPEEKEGDK